jgi:hypothetical protein
MEPNRVGRILGVGTRVASNILRERVAHTSQSLKQEAIVSESASDSACLDSAHLGKVYADQGRHVSASGARDVLEKGSRVARGTRRFGQSIWGPFAHAGSVLWLEVTGLFFALFTLFFASNIYRLRAFYWSGAEHQKFLVYVLCTALFLYFTVSSFYRASRKSRKS